MSVSVDTGGKGGKKALNAELNLVPYIDLLTCMVAFLLITAVWTQLARLQTQQKGQGQAGEETPPEIQVKVVILVNQEGFNLVVGQGIRPRFRRKVLTTTSNAWPPSSRRRRMPILTRTTPRWLPRTLSSSTPWSEPWTRRCSRDFPISHSSIVAPLESRRTNDANPNT